MISFDTFSKRRFVALFFSAIGGLVMVAAIAVIVMLAVRLASPTVVITGRDVWPMGTFHTQDLVVDDLATTSTLIVATGTGQQALFATKRATSTDGENICIGGGCQLVAYDGVNVHSASSLTSLGLLSMISVTTGSDLTGMGEKALQNVTTGQLNVAYGNDALGALISGSYHTAVGANAMQSMLDDVDNTCIGEACMLNVAHGDGNFAGGVQALEGGAANQTITHSVALGLNAAQTFLTGAGQITAIGYQSLGAITTAVAPTALGAFSLQACTTCTASTGLGASSGPNLTTGQYNTFVGGLAGGGITTGSFNTIVGAQVGGLAAGLSNNVIIADGAGNQRITVDNTGIVALKGAATVAGNLSVTNNSNQFSIIPTAANAVTFRENTSGANLLDFDPVASTGTEAITYRYFRHTNTTGAKQIQITNGNTTAANIILDPNAHSQFRGGIYINSVTTDDPDPTSGAFDVQNVQAGLTSNHVAVKGNEAATYNTTAGALTATSGVFLSLGSRSAGANTLTNRGGFFDAASAQVNQAIFADRGDVVLNNTSGTVIVGPGAQIISSGTPTANHGSVEAGSTNWSGTITGVGANTSVVLTYSAAFTNRSRCTANFNTSVGAVEALIITNSASAPTFSCFNTTTGVAANCEDFTYQCIGQ